MKELDKLVEKWREQATECADRATVPAAAKAVVYAYCADELEAVLKQSAAENKPSERPNKKAHDMLIDLRAAAVIGRPITHAEVEEMEQSIISSLKQSAAVIGKSQDKAMAWDAVADFLDEFQPGWQANGPTGVLAALSTMRNFGLPKYDGRLPDYARHHEGQKLYSLAYTRGRKKGRDEVHADLAGHVAINPTRDKTTSDDVENSLITDLRAAVSIGRPITHAEVDEIASLTAQQKAPEGEDQFYPALGEPPSWFDEWFIAELDNRERVVLRRLPEEYSFDYTTADGTYFKAFRLKSWMQFPDSKFKQLGNPDSAALEWHEHQATTPAAAPERDGGEL